MPIKIHNKDYKTVAERVNEFRGQHQNLLSIETEIVKFEAEDCIIRAVIRDENGRVLATGLAHEVKGSTNINKTSHVENCETSAIGRALAALGFAGTEYASADEVSTAIINQAVQEASGRFIRHMSAVKECFDTVAAIKEGVANGTLDDAVGAYYDLDEDQQKDLALAPTKGGVWTPQEYATFKSNEWGEAKNRLFNRSAA
jgi:hypothetical protein